MKIVFVAGIPHFTAMKTRSKPLNADETKHSPADRTVPIDNAAHIFDKAKHPKSFVVLDGADHLLSDPDDARYAGELIGAWAGRYVGRGQG